MAMPHMAGNEMAARMLSLRPDIPILLCTGHSDDIDEKRAKELGIRGFLMKPLNRKKLVETVLKLLDTSK
jgi:response regulator RpfG family c-di-GMP phosphodiesterase